MESLLSPGHTTCAGCGVAIAIRQLSKGCPENVIVSNATSCLEVTTSAYPQTSWNVPWLHAAFETSSSVASGIEAAIRKLNKPWKVLSIAGDGGTFDIGIQAISGTLERGQKVTHVCVDNEAYMNCLSKSSLIMTRNGLKKITQIRPGDQVYAFDHKTQKLVLKRCTGVYDNGTKPVYDLETHHQSIRATSNHPFLILKRNGRGRENRLIWKTLSEVREGDEVVTMKNLEGGNPFRFTGFRKVEKGDYKVNKLNDVRLPESSSPELMEYLGMWVGDGWTRPMRGEVGFALPEGTRARDTLLDLNSNVFGADASTNDDYIYTHSVNLARFIDSLGFGHGARNKIIPPWVFTLTKEEKESFVHGMMMTDGCIINNSHRYVSASQDLLRTMRMLLQTMDWRVGKMHQQTKPAGTRVVYRELLKDSQYGYICFSRKKGRDNDKYPSQSKYDNFLAGNERFEMQKVTGIRLVGNEPTLDLRVEDAHNFVSDGIIVHNTGVQRSGATPHDAWTTTSPIGKKSSGKPQNKKPILEIIAAHRIPYAASASIAYPADLVQKMKKAFEKQPSFVHIHCPCPAGWKIPESDTVKLGRLAVDTGMWILYEIEDGQLKINRRIPNRKPVSDYLTPQGRFKHLTPENIKEIQSMVDGRWEEMEAREKAGLRFLY